MNNLFVKLSEYRRELEKSIQAKEYLNILNKIDDLLDEISTHQNNSDYINSNDLLKRSKDFIEREEKYRILYQSTRDAIVIVTEDGFQDCNQAALDMFGYKNKKEFLNLHPADISPEYQPNGKKSTILSKNIIKEAYSKKTPLFEWTHRKKNGDVFPCEVLLSPLSLKSETVIQSVIRDISERKNNEIKLKKSEEKFRALSDLSPAGICILTIDNYFYVNKAWCELTEYSEEESKKLKPLDIVDPQMRDLVRTRSEARFRGEDVPSRYNIKIITKKGKEKWIDISFTIINYEGYFATLALMHDITERRKAQEKLKNSEEKFRKLTELSPSGISIQRKNEYIYVNKAWCKITGYSVKESKTVGPFDIIHPDMREYVWNLSEQKLKKKGANLRYDLKIITKDQEIKWLDISITTIKYKNKDASFAICNDITEVRKIQESLKLSEEKFRKLTELSPTAICIQTTDKFLWTNPAWSEITGYSQSELSNIGPLDIIHPDMRKISRERSDARLNNEDVITRYNLKVLTKDNKVKWVDIAISVIEFEGKTASLVVCSEITKQIEVQDALKQSEQKYRGLIENLRQEYIFFRHNPDGNFEYVSPSVTNILGFEQEDFSKNYYEYFTKNPINNTAKEKRELGLQGIQQLPYELEIYDIQKNKHILEISEAPIVDSLGNVLFIEGIAHDITSRKKAEKIIQDQLEEIKINNEEIKSINEELHAVNDDLEARLIEIDILNKELSFSKTKYENLVKNIPGIVFRYRIDKEWTMEYISNEVEVITGYKASDFILNNTRSFTSIIHAEDRDRVYQTINDSICKKQSYSVEYRLVDSRKEIIWVYERGQLLKKGKKKLLNGVILDITDKKKVEEKLIESEKELRRLNAQKDKFFSLLAHDLRSPIGNFLQISELLKLNYEGLTVKQANDFFDNLYTLSDRTFKLLENLLMWSRSQLGRLEIEPTDLPLKKVLDDVLYLLEENLKSKNIILENNIADEIVVKADLNVVQTLFRNLIGNAIKFSFEKGKITVNCKEIKSVQKEHVVVSIEDKGVGIPSDKVDRIFNMDEDYSTLGTNREKGTGLGLILCKEIIEKTGERIWVESQEGKGSSFYFTLKS